jgi:hypothetical protein
VLEEYAIFALAAKLTAFDDSNLTWLLGTFGVAFIVLNPSHRKREDAREGAEGLSTIASVVGGTLHQLGRGLQRGLTLHQCYMLRRGPTIVKSIRGNHES